MPMVLEHHNRRLIATPSLLAEVVKPEDTADCKSADDFVVRVRASPSALPLSRHGTIRHQTRNHTRTGTPNTGPGGTSMTLSRTVEDIERYVQELHREEKFHRGRADKFAAQRTKAEEALRALRELSVEFKEWNDQAIERRNRLKRHGHVTPEHIAHLDTQHAALQEIARLSDGLVNPTEAAHIVMEAGMTKSERHGSLVSTLQKLLAEGDTWEWVDAGVYRLKGFVVPEPKPEPEPESNNEEGPIQYASLDPDSFDNHPDPLDDKPILSVRYLNSQQEESEVEHVS